MSILDKDSMTEDHWSNNPRFRKTSITAEDEEFNRIEREASMRKAAVAATVAKREWIGLTDEEIVAAIHEAEGFAFGLDNGNVSDRAVIEYVRIVESKLREKNT
jgi:hypothetical protein